MLAQLDSDLSVVVRSHFSDNAAWIELCRLIQAPYEDGFRAYVAFIDGPRAADIDLDQLIAFVQGGPYRSFFFVADRLAITDADHPILVVDLVETPGRTFRVVPAQIWAVENNLSLANMDFSEFADSADADGVFRGFKAT